MTTRTERMRGALSSLNPEMLEVIDDSDSHHGHFGTDEPNIETHFIIKIKASWEVTSILDKHRKIKELIKDEFDRGLHALNIEIL